MDIRAFLTARLDDDGAIARAANPGPWMIGTERPHLVDDVVYGRSVDFPGHLVQVCNVTSADPSCAQHIARWDPDRVLREIAAKRALIAEHARIWLDNQWVQDADGQRNQRSVPVCRRCAHDGYDILFGKPVWPCNTLKLLVAPYTDHPEYDAAWKTEAS